MSVKSLCLLHAVALEKKPLVFTKTCNSFKALYNNSALYEYRANRAEEASNYYSGASTASDVQTEHGAGPPQACQASRGARAQQDWLANLKLN